MTPPNIWHGTATCYIFFIGKQWHVNLCGSTSCCFLLISISGHHYLISFHEIHAFCCPKCFPMSLDPFHIPSYTFIINRKVVCDLPTISSTPRILPQQIHDPEIATQNPWQKGNKNTNDSDSPMPILQGLLLNLLISPVNITKKHVDCHDFTTPPKRKNVSSSSRFGWWRQDRWWTLPGSENVFAVLAGFFGLPQFFSHRGRKQRVFRGLDRGW